MRYRRHVSRRFRPVLVLSICACVAPTHSLTGEPGDAAPSGRLGDNVVPVRYSLDLTIDPSRETFGGTTAISVEIREPTDTIWLHGKNLDVTVVRLTPDGQQPIDANYEQVLESGVARVSLPKEVEPGLGTLEFVYTAPFNTSTNALFRVERDGLDYAATQFQPIAARQVLPGFDEPAFKVPFDIALTTRPGHVAVTTTPQAAVEELDNGMRRHVFMPTRPMPTYLLAFAVGPYEVVDHVPLPANEIRKREIPLRAVVARGLDERTDYALENTEGLMTVLEQYFGSPYPYRKLDLIAMPESFGGAMENVGAITYDESFLIMNDDAPLDQRRAYTAVHAHELAHMWFGNLVTPEWWNDIWLNESFATWIMYKAADRYWPDGEFGRDTLKGALNAMNNDSLASARQIREPIERNEQIGSAFDTITYQKGGGVLAMLERYVGEEEFRNGIREHLARHVDGVADAEDFIASLTEGSDRVDIEAAFKSFVEQPGVPLLQVALRCDAGQPPALQVTQSRYAPSGSRIDPDGNRWHVPMCIRVGTAAGSDTSCTLITQRQQTFELDTSACPDWVHPNADGAGYFRFALDNAGWRGLLATAGQLDASEAIVLADSLDASFRSGRTSAQDYIAGMAALVDHPAWDVAGSATDHLEKILDVIPADQHARIYPALSSIVGPRFDALGERSTAGDELLYERLQRFLIVVARNEAMRAPLARQAAERIGLDGEPDPAAVPPGQLESVLSIGVQDIGEPFFDELLELAAASDDPVFRDAATGALARAEDPRLVGKLQEAVLDGSFRGVEPVQIVFRQMSRFATTDLTYDWLQENDDAVIGLVPESFRTNIVPAFGRAFCERRRVDDWQNFIERHADKLPGYERALAQAIESIELCAALRLSSASDLVAALEVYR